MDPLLSRLVEFCQRPSFQGEFEKFTRSHCHEFADGEEHRFRYTELYNEFQERFDAQLSRFLEEEKLDEADFYAHCKRLEEKDDAVARHFLQVMLSSASYDAFVKLMREVRDEEAATTRHSTGGGRATRVRESGWASDDAAGAASQAEAEAEAEEKAVELNAAPALGK